tara:strand:- start:916 stop:2181 length:1266 start_codon:yes stop_codon:yes gene_type:complete
MNKPTLAVQLGPLHLFWVTGIYYLWELKDKYNFIIFVNDDYKKSEKFLRILKYFDIMHIHYQKKEKGFKLVSSLLKEYKAILEKFKPCKFLIYNNSFVDNQCLIYLIKKSNFIYEIFQYQNGKEALNIENDRFFMTAVESKVLQDKFKFLKNFNKISLRLSKIRRFLIYLYYFKFIPLCLTGKVFKPPFNIFTGKYNNKVSKNSRKLINKYFVYLDTEAKAVSKLGVLNSQLIDHPLKNSHKEINNIIYGEVLERNQIAIMPSHGFIEGLIAKGCSYHDVSIFISKKYIEFLKIFQKKFPSYPIFFKLHPDSMKNRIWSTIIKLISHEIKITNITDNKINAEKLIIESKIIISDVSTVLWWTIFFDEKIAISLDIFDFENGDEMINYAPHIYYVKDLRQIEKTNFLKISNLNNYFSIKKFL